MSSYTEQEEFEKFKSWWKNYGNALILGVVLGAAIIGGNKYWTHYKEEQYQKASDLFLTTLQSYHNKNYEQVEAQVKNLIENYRATPYASMGSLLMAKVHIEQDNQKLAILSLRNALNYAQDEASDHVARLRLARLLFEKGDYDEALSLLDRRDIAGYEVDYFELRGDIHLKQKNIDSASIAYNDALKAISEDDPYRNILQMKVDHASQNNSYEKP
jgi:predicted negative regulator of RcsB-dependent stress response